MIFNEEFEKWWKSIKFNEFQFYAAKAAWRARQPEIDALKADNSLQKETSRELARFAAKLKEEIATLKIEKFLELFDAAAHAAPAQDEPVAEIICENIGRPFNAAQIRIVFYEEVPPVGTQLYATPQSDKLLKTAEEILELLESMKSEGHFNSTDGFRIIRNLRAALERN